jgi:hypothetical protein
MITTTTRSDGMCIDIFARVSSLQEELDETDPALSLVLCVIPLCPLLGAKYGGYQAIDYSSDIGRA